MVNKRSPRESVVVSLVEERQAAFYVMHAGKLVAYPKHVWRKETNLPTE